MSKIEERTLKILFNKSGGSSTGTTTRLTLPKKWIDAMGLSMDNRNVNVTFDGDKIIIKKL
jgi:hypothetical protein